MGYLFVMKNLLTHLKYFSNPITLKQYSMARSLYFIKAQEYVIMPVLVWRSILSNQILHHIAYVGKFAMWCKFKLESIRISRLRQVLLNVLQPLVTRLQGLNVLQPLVPGASCSLKLWFYWQYNTCVILFCSYKTCITKQRNKRNERKGYKWPQDNL